ncbi:MAG: hypothetical protein ACOY71_09745, partial [Gemmatimonadota bacterium]
MRSLRDALRTRLRRVPAIALFASLAVHAVVFVFPVIEGRAPQAPPRPRHLLVLTPLQSEGRAVPVPFRQRRENLQSRRPRSGGAPVLPRTTRPTPAPTVVAQAAEPRALPPADSGAVQRPPPIGSLRPSLGGGRLWVRPLPVPPKELAQRITRSHVELVDSAVTAIVQSYLDSIAAMPES